MTKQRKPRGPYRKSAERREQILQAAYEAVDEHGERASLQDIAERVGATRAALVYYFPTREDLLLAVLERRDTLGQAFTVAVAEGGTMVEGMAAATRVTTDHPGLAKLYITLSAAATDPGSPAHDFFAERYRSFAAQVAPYFAESQENGTMRGEFPPELLARAVLAMVDGLQLQWMHDPTVDIGRIAEFFTRMLMASDHDPPAAE